MRRCETGMLHHSRTIECEDVATVPRNPGLVQLLSECGGIDGVLGHLTVDRLAVNIHQFCDLIDVPFV
mgnify:CR=1 FL=1